MATPNFTIPKNLPERIFKHRTGIGGYKEVGKLTEHALWSLKSLAKAGEVLVVRYKDIRQRMVYVTLDLTDPTEYYRLINPSMGYLEPTLLIINILIFRLEDPATYAS